MFKGAFTAIVTPFAKGEVDYERLGELMEFQLSGGISGLVPCGTTGESATLSLEEHHSVLKFVISEVKGRVPIIAGAGSNNTAEAINLAAYSKEIGADAAMLVAPYYNKPTQEGLYLHFSEVAKKVNIPIILYNVPGRTSSNILPETVARLSEITNIVGLKEATGDMKQVGRTLELVEDDFAVLSGDDFTTLPLLSLGGVGAISVTSNVAPGDVSIMVRDFLDGNLGSALEYHYRLSPLFRAMFLETNPVPAKAALGLMGKIDPTVRLPMAPLSNDNLNKLKGILRDYGLI